MLLEIPCDEKAAHEYACAVSGLTCRFLETDFPGVIKVKVTNEGRKVSAVLAYRLKGIVDQKMRADREERRYNALREEDLSPNNVLVLVEDLPQ